MKFPWNCMSTSFTKPSEGFALLLSKKSKHPTKNKKKSSLTEKFDVNRETFLIISILYWSTYCNKNIGEFYCNMMVLRDQFCLSCRVHIEYKCMYNVYCICANCRCILKKQGNTIKSQFENIDLSCFVNFMMYQDISLFIFEVVIFFLQDIFKPIIFHDFLWKYTRHQRMSMATALFSSVIQSVFD